MAQANLAGGNVRYVMALASVRDVVEEKQILFLMSNTKKKLIF